ncbi:MAG: 3-isopropylmalate dehydratase [Phycisphaerae bacterium]|jgi:3-isopropylmalate/(R)-2-methylmalate dehydratase small subunit|nr:3-isopropylmalate dehydratase [Phycisphaerae bacterium]
MEKTDPMHRKVRGKAFVVGDNIDTDQIIPAQYLSYNPADSDERKFFGKYAMSGVPESRSGLPQGNVPFIAADRFRSEFFVIIGGTNFGCGSSREHAPLAIAEAGCRVVVAESYARIFYRNSINGGYLVPFETPRRLIDEINTGQEVWIDAETSALVNVATGRSYDLRPLGDVSPIIRAGGIFEYARRSGMLE